MRLNSLNIALFSIAIAIASYGLFDQFTIKRAIANGEMAIIEPISDYSRSKTRGFPTKYMAQIKFSTKSGETISTRAAFPGEAIPDVRSGRPVKVFYDARTPSKFVFELDSGVLTTCLIYSAIIAALGLFLLGPKTPSSSKDDD